MAKIAARLELDDAVLHCVDAVARHSGRSRSQVVEDSIRRGLAGPMLDEVMARVRGRSELDEEQALDAAYDAVKAARATRGPARE